MLKKCSNKVRPAAVALLSAAIGLSAAADSEKLDLDISSDRVGSALIALGETAGVQIMVPRDIGVIQRPVMIKGQYTLAKALDEMLKNTGLSYQFTSENMVVIQTTDEGGGRSSETLKNGQQLIEEITVTATKRETRLQDTSVAISVLDKDSIEKRGLYSMGDYLNTVPGVTIQDRGAGANSITMRGLSVSPQTERTAVGVYFGDTPVSGMNSGDSTTSSDLRMVDIERVEVLKGPQGTLYGADSMGGIVRIIPAAPNLQEWEGRVGVQYSSTGKFGGDNHQMQGVFNIPVIEDQLALRAVVYRFENSGYFKNVVNADHSNVAVAEQFGAQVQPMSDVGRDETTGFRLSALWQPIEDLTVNLGYFQQKIDQNGMREGDLSLSESYHQVRVQSPFPLYDAVNNHPTPKGPDGLTEEVKVVNLVLDYDLGWGGLHSSSSWVNRSGAYIQDFTHFGFGIPATWSISNDGERFTQELRFASEFDGAFQFLAGLYYEEYENDYPYAEYYTGDPALAAEAQALPGWDLWEGHENVPYHYVSKQFSSVEQAAFFGEVSYDITDHLTATFGARHYQYDQANYIDATGWWVFSETPVTTADLKGSYSGESYKANLSWAPNDDTLIYAQWAEGFRLGRTQSRQPQHERCDSDGNGYYDVLGGGEVPVINGSMEPDSTSNYELGYKAAFVDGRVSLSTAIYHIDWEGVPVLSRLANDCGSYWANLGESTSRGVELDARLYLSEQWLLNLGGSYNKSTLANNSPLGNKGDDLPGAADINFSAGLEYGFVLAGYEAFARLDYAYVGEYDVYLNQPDSFPVAGDYSQFHLKSGIVLNQLALDLFVNNLTNADALTWIESFGAKSSAPAGFRLRPRTIGLNLNYTF